MSRCVWKHPPARGSPSAATTRPSARAPSNRLMEEQIKRPLAEKLLFGPLAERGGRALISLAPDGSGLAVKSEPREKRPGKKTSLRKGARKRERAKAEETAGDAPGGTRA